MGFSDLQPVNGDSELATLKKILQATLRTASMTRALGPIRAKTVDGNFAPLDPVACFSVVITNTTGKAVNYRRGGSGEEVTVPNNSGKVVDVASSASEIEVRNSTDTASIAVKYECNGEAV